MGGDQKTNGCKACLSVCLSVERETIYRMSHTHTYIAERETAVVANKKKNDEEGVGKESDNNEITGDFYSSIKKKSLSGHKWPDMPQVKSNRDTTGLARPLIHTWGAQYMSVKTPLPPG